MLTQRTPENRAPSSSGNSLKLRIISGLVLAPIALAAAWAGWPWLPIVTAIAGGVMAWEWARLCGGGRIGTGGSLLVGTTLVAVAVASAAGFAAAIALSGFGAALVFAAATREPGAQPWWLGIGTLWVTLPCVLLLWLAHRVEGRDLLLWIFAVVWATDIGAYVVGRWLGGPRLAPRWSPRKTWAGLVGGIVCAALAGWTAGHLLAATSVLPLVLISAGLAIIEQFGDLAESVAKRRFGVKDTSALIPGHGGLLDRLDGLLAVIPVVALLSLIGGGSVLEWR